MFPPSLTPLTLRSHSSSHSSSLFHSYSPSSHSLFSCSFSLSFSLSFSFKVFQRHPRRRRRGGLCGLCHVARPSDRAGRYEEDEDPEEKEREEKKEERGPRRVDFSMNIWCIRRGGVRRNQQLEVYIPRHMLHASRYSRLAQPLTRLYFIWSPSPPPPFSLRKRYAKCLRVYALRG